MKQKEITFTLYVGDKKVETLTAEQRKRIADRLSKTMSLYYTNHALEYQKLKG